MTKQLSKGKQPAVIEPRRKMDWKVVVCPGDNIPPSGHKMETDAREYLEAKRAAALQRSASGQNHGVPPFPKVKLPTIEPFDGTTDPDDHLSAYKHQMYFQAVDDATWCKNFPATLKGVAQKWFNNLPPNSVNNFTELSILFITSHFVANRQEQKTSMHLGKVIQGPKEALRSYVKRFSLEALQIHHLNAGVAFDAFIRGLRPESFKFNLVKKKISTLTEALQEVEAFIHATEVCAEAKHPEIKKIEETIQPKKSIPKKAETWAVTSMTTSSKRSKRSEPESSVEPIEFSKDQYSILMEIKDQYELKAPVEMKTPYRNRIIASTAISTKIVVTRRTDKKDNRQGRRKDDESTDEDVVLVISGGFAARGPTNRGHKNYLRELSQLMLTNQAESDPFPKIMVSKLDRGKIRTPRDDPLVVEMKIANLRVRRILIDTGSSTDIISTDCLSRLKFDENNLVLVNHPLDSEEESFIRWELSPCPSG
ncbi:uncharacterized protein LOC125493373 [Beta vulgaris subsp. vulgaris]|uniref:uncharacterized protein LOC125493373 n=1 Tax=Beta vulgaris subsp. vulgaris TaxID=3555 RepID=UPI002547C73E|nr:uncharacterized protein LOC125493373 [Beta vulgaris subsp. vulgaris]